VTDEKIREYEIIEALGNGGFGSVWKARSPGGEIVAIKLLNPQFLSNDLVVRKFFHEAMVLARLDHKNITKLKEFFPDGSNYVIVMEYVEGITLREFLDQKKSAGERIDYAQALDMARQILDAFQYAHEANVIHRDIKAGNIMMSKDDLIKIMDFGIAKISTAPTHHTSARMFSPHYTAPERFKERPVDERSDIYSLGIVFYELFTSEKPFDSKDAASLVYSQLNDPPPTKYLKTLPGQINLAILRALEKEPEKRFQNCQEFSRALGLDIPVQHRVERNKPIESQNRQGIDINITHWFRHKKRKTLCFFWLSVLCILLFLFLSPLMFYESLYRGVPPLLTDYPYFPWPPPKASAKDKIPNEFLRKTKSEQIFLQDIDRRLNSALDEAGYFDKSYFAVPDGFAIVTRLEQIHTNGISKPDPQRWASEVGPLREFSISAYLRALFTSNAGYFRVIVFIVTHYPFTQADISVNRDQAVAWLHEGLDKLPRSIGRLSYSEDYSCTALIYEFEKIDDEKEAVAKIPGRHTGRKHLIKSQLWSKLEG
jgi:serine/threonine protein kinase